MTDRAEVTLSPWARVLDVLSVLLFLAGVSVVITGGFREWTPLGRLSVTSWIRPVAVGVVALLVRHWVWRRPSIVARAVAAATRWHRSDEVRGILPVFISTRVGVLVVGFLGIIILGYAPNNPPWRVYENDLLNLPARWDTGWYLGVAIDGYSFEPLRSNRQQNIAFFPAYPMLMRYGSLFTARETLWLGVAISFVSFFWALVYLFRLAREYLDEDAAAASVALLATYPFAFFFSAAYTEALFLLTVVAACYHFERDQMWKAAAWGLLAGLTRPNGCLLSVVLALMALRPEGQRALKPGHYLGQWRQLGRRLGERIAAASAPGIGMLMYSTFIYSLTGNPLQWAAQNAAWGRVYQGLDVLVGDRIRYIHAQGLLDYASTQWVDMTSSVAVLFVLVSVWPVYRRFGAPYAAMILVNMALPLTMGGLLSMGRLSSVVFPTFLWLGAAVPARHRTGWLMGFAMLQALLAIAFFTWRPLY